MLPSDRIGDDSGRVPRFRLVRYFTLTSLVMFVLVSLALAYFESQQGEFFKQVQRRQGEFFKSVQSAFARQQDEAARRDLLIVHEAGNVNLTRLFANALWEKDFAPFAARAALVPVDRCRAIADVTDAGDGKPKAPPEKKACFAEVGRSIMALPGFAGLSAKVYDAMKRSTVFKVKVFDLRGITIYSSEHAQIGEDKSGNAGWRNAALQGRPTSEMTFRDKFSAFEGVVEKRDLISSYLPMHAPGDDRVVGVFEVYSDVTPFLAQIRESSAQTARAAAGYQAQVARAAADDQAKVESAGTTTLATVLALLALLFAALYALVRRADGIISAQARERERSQQKLAEAEKMASLGQMVAGVAHQLNTPLAFSQNNVAMAIDALKGYELPLRLAGAFARLVKGTDKDAVAVNIARARPQVERINEADLDVAVPTEMLRDTLHGIEQMCELVQNLRDFTRLDRSKVARADLNRSLHNVVYIARTVMSARTAVVEEFSPLPEIECNASQLNQVFLNLINNAAQAMVDGGTITVRSGVEGGRIRVDVSDDGPGIPEDVLPNIWDTYFTTKQDHGGTGLGLPIARTIVDEHGGEIAVQTETGKGTTFTVYLPVDAGERMAA